MTMDFKIAGTRFIDLLSFRPMLPASLPSGTTSARSLAIWADIRSSAMNEVLTT